MSGYPFDRSFHPGMSKCLLDSTTDFRVDNILVPCEKLISTDTLLNELDHALSRCGWPSRTIEVIREEILSMQGRWMKQQLKSETYLEFEAKHIFMDWRQRGRRGYLHAATSVFCIVEGQEFCIAKQQKFFIVEGQEFFIVEGQEFCVDGGWRWWLHVVFMLYVVS